MRSRVSTAGESSHDSSGVDRVLIREALTGDGMTGIGMAKFFLLLVCIASASKRVEFFSEQAAFCSALSISRPSQSSEKASWGL